ncbi:MAG: hypothetical protein ACK5LJ_15425 [Paracoccus sp. (in: a-proteobacteria)]
MRLIKRNNTNRITAPIVECTKGRSWLAQPDGGQGKRRNHRAEDTNNHINHQTLAVTLDDLASQPASRQWHQ